MTQLARHTNTLTTLFKKDSKGKTRIYETRLFPDHFSTLSGLLGGNLTECEHWPTPKGGRTLAEQIISEAQSRWDKKFQRELYHVDPTFKTPHPHQFEQPMLAHDYTKVPHRVDWSHSWSVQPKLNGVRCIAEHRSDGAVILTSRKGKRYDVPYIANQLAALPRGTMLDGELYIHGVELGDVTHAVANAGEHPHLQYHVFDMLSIAGIDVKQDPFVIRSQRVKDLFEDKLKGALSLKRVPTVAVLDEHDLFIDHSSYTAKGYEGAMLRDNDAPYENKRSLGLFKYKTFQDDEFVIKDVNPDKDGGAILTLSTDTGQLFQSRPMGTDEYRARLLADRTSVIGKMATVKYSTLLKTGVPEFNRVIGVRDYE